MEQRTHAQIRLLRVWVVGMQDGNTARAHTWYVITFECYARVYTKYENLENFDDPG